MVRTAVAASALLSLATTLAAGGLTAAAAHHGINAFDHNRDVHLEGAIVRLDFVNPHSWLYLDVTGADGAVQHYRCELRAATVLRRSGWTPEMFPMGAPIAVDGSPHRSDPNSCYLNTAVFEDGSSVDRYGQITAAPAEEVVARIAATRDARAPTGEPNVFGDWAAEQVVMTDPRGKAGALVPLSTVDEYAPGAAPEGGAPLPGSRGAAPAGSQAAPATGPWAARGVEPTEAGRLASESFETYSAEDNPRMRCETTSVLFDWTFDGPVNRITRVDDATITLEYGQYGFTRTIHLGATEHPADVAPSRAGHSIGRWEGDELVVDTAGFAPGVLSPPILNSEELHVVERFALDPETMALTRSYVATDPVYFVGEYAGSDTILPSPLPFAPDPCDDTTFVDYSQAAAEAGANK